MNHVYQEIARTFGARLTCQKTGNTEWAARHEETLARLCAEWLPRGGGFDTGTHMLLDESKPERLVFRTSYHHMTDHGYYDGWTEHSVVVTPSLAQGFDLKVKGLNRNDVKDYIAETFHIALGAVMAEVGV